MIHLAGERDCGAEYDGAHGRADVGKIDAVLLRKQRAKPVRNGDTHEQNCEPRRTRDLRPIGGDEDEKSRGDEQRAEDADDGCDIDALGQRAELYANGLGDGRRDDAVVLPNFEIGIETLPVGRFMHRASPCELS